MTEWRPVHENPNYSVSDDGQVIRVTPGAGTRAGRAINPFISNTGYPTVGLGRKQYTVHRLMMAAFYGPSDLLVRHLDDVKTNNTLENLAYGTFHDNAQDLMRNRGHRYSNRNHCSRGHEYTPETTATKRTPNGNLSRVCKTCRADVRAARVGTTDRVTPPETCLRGHPYNSENLRWTPQGYRYCKACDRERRRAAINTPHEHNTTDHDDDLAVVGDDERARQKVEIRP